MTTKEVIVKVYNKLADDSDLLSLMGIPSADSMTREARILKVRQVLSLADKNIKLCIWHGTPSPSQTNPKVERRMLVVDVHVPAEVQKSTGIGTDIAEKVSSSLDKLEVGTGLSKAPIQFDLQTAYGWYKASVPFIYNYISK